jgi:acyl carrier protein
MIKLVADIVSRGAAPPPIADDVELVAIGFSSVDMVNLMLAIEAEFDLMIPPDEITPANFRSVSSLLALLAKLLASAPPAGSRQMVDSLPRAN